MSVNPTAILEAEHPPASPLQEPLTQAAVTESPYPEEFEFGPLPPELWPNVDHVITEDDTPVDNFYSEKQQKLSTQILYATPHPFGVGRPFIAVSNIGLFNTPDSSPQVPDVMVSLDVALPENVWEKRRRTYFIWEFGKTPELAIEIVSNKVGGEDDAKMRRYAQLRIPYYVIYDPEQQLSEQRLRVYELRGASYVQRSDYWLPDLGLGLTLWQGKFEDREDTWLRWCDQEGNLLLTSYERAEQERQRAEQEHQRAEQEKLAREGAQKQVERLLAQLRALGVKPDIHPQGEE